MRFFRRQPKWLREPLFGVLFVVIASLGLTPSGGVASPLFFSIVLMGGAIAVARRWPILGPILSLGFFVEQLLWDTARLNASAWPIYVLVLVPQVITSAYGSPAARRAALLLSVPMAAAAACLLSLRQLSPQDYPTINIWGSSAFVIPNIFVVFIAGMVLLLGAWWVGSGFRDRRATQLSEVLRLQAESELHAAEAQLLVTTERERIAQDVHDIMAHSLSVIVAQADGARFIGSKQPSAIFDSLEAISSSARDSLAEVRMLIENLVADPEGHSHPTLVDLDSLFERMRSAGLDTSLQTFGAAGQLTTGQELAVYRIVQEGLTNALKHAGTDPRAAVVLDWRGPGLAVNVNSASAQPKLLEPGSAGGRGIHGMRERARLAGGWLTADFDNTSDEQVFIVTAFIPAALKELAPLEDQVPPPEQMKTATEEGPATMGLNR